MGARAAAQLGQGLARLRLPCACPQATGVVTGEATRSTKKVRPGIPGRTRYDGLEKTEDRTPTSVRAICFGFYSVPSPGATGWVFASLRCAERGPVLLRKGLPEERWKGKRKSGRTQKNLFAAGGRGTRGRAVRGDKRGEASTPTQAHAAARAPSRPQAPTHKAHQRTLESHPHIRKAHRPEPPRHRNTLQRSAPTRKASPHALQGSPMALEHASMGVRALDRPSKAIPIPSTGIRRLPPPSRPGAELRAPLARTRPVLPAHIPRASEVAALASTALELPLPLCDRPPWAAGSRQKGGDS